MSRPFAAVESFLERIMERPAARLFRAHPQPVHLERRIERAMTAHKMVRGGHTYVPSRYRIVLNPADLVALREATDQLPDDLADAILTRARSQGYWLVARPEVMLVPSARIAQGDLEVDAEPLDPSLVSSAAAGLRPVGLEGPRPPRAPIPGTGVVPDPLPGDLPELEPIADPEVRAASAAAWMPLEATPPPVDELLDGTPTPVSGSARAASLFLTAVPAGSGQAADAAPATPGPGPAPAPAPTPASVPVPVPVPVSPAPAIETVADLLTRAAIFVQGPDGAAPLLLDFEGGTLTVGRGTDNDIVILDGRVSRHHGRFTARHGVLVYTDLDSTNGSLVNGMRARDVALGVGDVVRLGRTTLTIRSRT